VCHAPVLTGNATAGPIQPGPCPRPLLNCIEFTSTGSFTIASVLTGLPPGAQVALVVPVVTAAGTPAGVRTVGCGVADASGRGATPR